MKKSIVEEEITLCGLARWLGIDTEDNTGKTVPALYANIPIRNMNHTVK